jgi:hypothetical protein
VRNTNGEGGDEDVSSGGGVGGVVRGRGGDGGSARSGRRGRCAERAYRIASDFGRDITVGVGQRAILEPRNRAGLALARLLIQSGRRDEAGHVLMKTDVTVRESRSQELSDQKRQLEQMLRR